MRMNPRQNQPIKINIIEIEGVNRFVYLGATNLQQKGGMCDVKGRVSKARSAFIKHKKI
jgi:hypothetical protein